MKDFSEINDLVESVECRMQDAYEQGYETGHKDGEARGIDKMNNLSKEAYAKGLKDAWKCARKIVKLSTDDRTKIFGDCVAFGSEFEVFSGPEAMKKVKEFEKRQKQIKRKVDCEVTACYNCINHNDCDYEYEEQQKQDEIKVGDEVEFRESVFGSRYVVVRIRDDGTFEALCECGTDDGLDLKKFRKTGRHFDEITKILEYLRGKE